MNNPMRNTYGGSQTQHNNNIDSIIRTGKAGNGAYGIVYIAERVKDKKPVVVKRNIIDCSTDFIGSIKEMDILNRLKGHPFIVGLVSVSYGNPFTSQNMSPILDRTLKEDKIHFVFEKAACDAHTLIHNNNTPYLIFKLIMTQLLLATEYMHGKKIIHRDLKPANLLWFENGEDKRIKICDFGLSKPRCNQGTQTPRVVTSWYRAPEICLQWPNYTTKVDMWSIGCILFEMISKTAFLNGTPDYERSLISKMFGLLPTQKNPAIIRKMFKYTNLTIGPEKQYRRKTMYELLGLNRQQINDFAKNCGDYHDFIDLLGHLLVIDPDQRYSATEALNHRFFDQFRYYIQDVRRLYPPVPAVVEPINIISCHERTYVTPIIYNIYNRRSELEWYTDRIIFQTMDMFDRYLEYKLKLAKSGMDRHDQTLAYEHEITLKFIVCLYVSIKYFSCLHIPVAFSELIAITNLTSTRYNLSYLLSFAENFEIELIQNVFELKIYRETIYEAADYFGEIHNSTQIRDLIVYYTNFNSSSGLTPREIYKCFLSKIGKNVSPVKVYLPTFNKNTSNDKKVMPTLVQLHNQNKKLPNEQDHTKNLKLKILDRVDYYQSKQSSPRNTVSKIAPPKSLTADITIDGTKTIT